VSFKYKLSSEKFLTISHYLTSTSFKWIYESSWSWTAEKETNSLQSCTQLEQLWNYSLKKFRLEQDFNPFRPVQYQCSVLPTELLSECNIPGEDTTNKKQTLFALVLTIFMYLIYTNKQSCHQRLLNIRDPLQTRCLNKDSVVVLSSLHRNGNKEKGSEDSNWNNIGLASLWLCDFACTRNFLQLCNRMLRL